MFDIKEIPLWPVQEYMLEELRNTIRYYKRLILMAGTGLGKTQIAIQIIKQALKKDKRCCFVCHRINLVEQTSGVFSAQGINHGVIQGNHPDYYPHRPVQVCSIQTLSKRDQSEFDIFFFDEVHVMFQAHKTILENNPDAFFIGLSATPMAVGLGKHFQALVHPVTMKDLIKQKVLKDFEIYGPGDIDLSKVRVVAGEYKKDDLANAADKPKLTADIIQTWLKLAKNEKTIVFCTSVAHGRHLEKEFLKHGVSAKEVNGYMRKENTEYEIGANQIIEDFKNDKFQVIISVEMLIAGFDVTNISCVVFATSTKSKMKWCQGIGRGLRKHEGLDICTIIDHGSITKNLGFPDDIEADFFELDDGKHKESKKKKKEKLEKLPKKCPSCDFMKPPGVRKCPACKFTPNFIEDVETNQGTLEKLKRKANRVYTKKEKQSFYNQLNQYGLDRKKNGKKLWGLGAISHKYRDKFGVWPNAMDKGQYEPPGKEVLNFIRHCNIRYAYSQKKAV